MLAALATIPIFTRPGSLKVRTTTVERGPIRSLISTNGKIEPIQNFEAHSPVATTVKRLFVKEGDHVRKGQLLLQLDDADLRSQAARAQAQMKAAQRYCSFWQRSPQSDGQQPNDTAYKLVKTPCTPGLPLRRGFANRSGFCQAKLSGQKH